MYNENTRKATNKFIGLVEDHLLDPMDAIVMCAKWMSEDDIKEMCKANEIDLFGDDEEIEVEDDDRLELPWDYGRHFD